MNKLAHNQNNLFRQNIFLELKENHKLFYNKDELIKVIETLLKNLEMNLVTSEILIGIASNIKENARKNKNLHIDPLFSLTYVMILMFNHNIIPQLSGKLLFSYAGIFSDINQPSKSCFAILKHFELQTDLNRKSLSDNKVWIENEFKKILNKMENINYEILNQTSTYLMNSLDFSRIIKNDVQMNFLILLINNLISNENQLKLLNTIYDFLNKNKNDMINDISSLHFNNIIKIICRINELLIKSNNLEYLKKSNMFKILLYDILFKSKHSNSDALFSFIKNNINEFLLLQKTHNWKEILKTNNKFLDDYLINEFLNFVVINLSAFKNNKSIHDYLSIIGKIYNFYNNFCEVNIDVINKTVYYSNLILNEFVENKIIVNETFMIKVNLFKDYLNKNRQKFNEGKVADEIALQIDELIVIIQGYDAEAEVFILIIKFLISVFENLVIILINNLTTFYSLWNITEKAAKLFDVILTNYKTVLNKKNEFSNINRFYNYLNLFNETDKSNKKYYLNLSKSLGDNINQTTLEEAKRRVNMLINYFSNTNEFEKIIGTGIVLSKLNFDLLFQSLNCILNAADKFSVSVDESNFKFYLEKILDFIQKFSEESENSDISSYTKEFQNIYAKMEKVILNFINFLITKVANLISENKIELFNTEFNTFCNYLVAIQKVCIKFKFAFKCEISTDVIIFLKLLESIIEKNNINTTEGNTSTINFIRKGIESNFFKQLVDYSPHFSLIENICFNFLGIRKISNINTKVQLNYNDLVLDIINSKVEKEKSEKSDLFNFMDNIIDNLKLFKQMNIFERIDEFSKEERFPTLDDKLCQNLKNLIGCECETSDFKRDLNLNSIKHLEEKLHSTNISDMDFIKFEWIIYLKILYLINCSYYQLINETDYTVEILNEFFYYSELYLNYTFSMLNKIITNEAFHCGLVKYIFISRKKLKFNSDYKVDYSNCLYLTLFPKLINDAKEVALSYLKLTCKFNRAEEFLIKVYKMSKFAVFFADLNFSKDLILLLFKISRKAFTNNDINPKFLYTEIRQIEFILKIIKIYDFYNRNDVSIFNLQDLNDKEKILNFIDSSTTTTTNPKIDKSLDKLRSFLNDKKFVKPQTTGANSINELSNFLIENITNLKRLRDIRMNISMDLVNNYFLKTENSLNLIYRINEEIVKNQNNFKVLNNLFKNYKKLMCKIIKYLIDLKESQVLSILLQFYIKRFINYKVFLFSQNRKFNPINDDIPNIISFFKIKSNFIFSINYENSFSYNVISDKEINPHLIKLKANFNSLKEGKNKRTTLSKREWYNYRNNLEKDFEETTNNFQEILISNLKEIIKSIYIGNKKFEEYVRSFYNKNTPKISFDEFINSVINVILKNNELTKNKLVLEVVNVFNKKQKLNSINDKISNLFDPNNIFKLTISSELANFPIENLPIFYKLPIFRSLNYNFLSGTTIKQQNLSRSEIAYLINPSGDLKDTEKSLKPVFQNEIKAKGYAGNEVTTDELDNLLKECKLYFYCGHSNGSKYIDTSSLKYSCRYSFINFLLGCSSVKIENIFGKDDEPFDIATYYYVNGSPCVIGCLWDVTDSDLDLFLKLVLEKIFKYNQSLLEAIISAKHYCSNRYLNSSAIVIYSNTDFYLSINN